MEQLKKEVQKISDEQLLDQFVSHQEEYTPEAIALINAEIKRRGLDIEKLSSSGKKNRESVLLNHDSDDFTPLDHVFNRMDLELVAAILRENRVMFYIDTPKSSDMIPREGEAMKQFTVHIHNSTIKDAHALLDEHFEKSDGKYVLKKMGIKEQLKAFSFHELRFSEKDMEEMAEVILTQQEKAVIINYGNRILDESDKIEQDQDRVIFYYDSIESLLVHLSGVEENTLSKTYLLTILEILQIFCGDRDFPTFMEESISTLLSFFLVKSNEA